MSASGRYSRTSGSLRTRTVQNESPYNRPLTNHGLVDKTSMIWRDFMNGVRKRKLLIERLKEAALEPTTHPSLLKRLMIEIRQLSLRVIEDGLEIEYRSQLTDKNGRPKAANLPPISAFRRMEEKDDVLSLAEMICDIDEIFHISSIKEMLPYQFPETRNPFMLGRSVDDLANLVPPHPEPGNTDEELKALELLRYKRASKALIRAEAQVANKLPINLQDVEKLLFEMIDDPNVEKLVRSVSTLLDNDGPDYGREAQWISLHSPQFHIEAHELLTKLNAYKGDHPMRVDVQAAIRQTLRDTNLEFLEDKTAIFLVEWVNSVLSRTLSRANRRDSTTAYSKRSHLTSPKRMGSARESAFHLNRGAQNLMSYEVIAVRPLSRENLQAHNEEYEELASIVSKMGMDIKETNYVEKPTRLKMQIHQEFQTSSTPEPKDPWIPAGVINSLSRSNLNTPAVGKRVSSPPRSPIASPTPIVSFTPNIPKLTVGDDVSVSSVGGGSVGNRSGKIGQSRLKQEIEKVIHELGLTNGKTAKSPYALKTINDFDSDYGDDENPDPNTLSSIRYQVAKMQQELLRRNVLDPKHFKVESVDTRNMRQKGLTVVDPDDAYSAPSKKAEPEEHLMFERDIVVGEMEKLCLDFVLDVTNEKLVGRINEFSLQEVTQDHVEFSLISSKKPPPKKVKSCIAYMPISKLMFNRLTDELFSVLYDGYESTKRKLLRVLSDHLQEKALQDPIPTGKLLITANRVLFQSVFTENGVVVDLVIMRNDDCNGLNVICTPLSGLSVGQASSGPVTIVIYDNELQVLLINQYGLYKMCLSRWSGMEAVAQWLSSRIIIRKVKTSDLALLPPKVEDQLINADTISISSEVTFGTAQNLPAVPDEAVVESKQMPDTIQNQMSKTMAEIRANKKALWMLDASIDRRVEISNAVLLQWKSRNVPAIAGATAKIRAIQDLEMLRFGVSLIIPTRKAFREIIPSTNKNELADLAEQSDDEDDEEEDSKPVEIHLEYRLTSAELLVFGSCDTSEKMKSVALGSVKSDEKHPEAFIWNILSRLKIVFKVNINFRRYFLLSL